MSEQTIENGYVVTTHPNPAGYSPGTWEYRVHPENDPGTLWFDGGYQSQDHAREAGITHARRLSEPE